MKVEKTDLIFCGAILASIFFFYPDLFFAKTASLAGDHLVQHYPWTFVLAKSLKAFEFPWWTPFIHCGFPIVAEGQIGLFYLPNLILCMLLPIQWAYSYFNILHFFISGCATYFYSRLMKLGALPSFIAAFIFLFGSAFGGAYYNITSLKTIAWFPVALCLFEKFYREGKVRHLAFLSFVLTLSLVAGYLQVAVLSLGIFLVYAVLRTFLFYEPTKIRVQCKLKVSGALAAAVAVSLLLALPQILLSVQLAVLSNRFKLTESYAYIGSLSPLAVLTFFFVEVQGFLRGNSFYSGVITICFMLCAVFSKSSHKTVVFKIWSWVGLIALFLSLGRWSPLYTGLVRLTHFYSFRVPAKFLVFVCFSIAILAGVGVETIKDSIRTKKNSFSIPKVSVTYSALMCIAIIGHVTIYYFVTVWQPVAIELGQWFARQFISGKAGHPYALELYYQRIPPTLEAIRGMLAINNLWNVWSYCLIFVGLFFLLKLSHSKQITQRWLLCSLMFLALDLYIFSWRDIRRDFDTYEHIYQPSPAVDRLMKEQAAGRVGRIYGSRSENESLPLVPSVNILYGLEDIGAYSPFVMKRYHETIGRFGNVNDSNFSFAPAIDFLNQHMNILDFLDVSHIFSRRQLDRHDLEIIFSDDRSELFLYRSLRKHARVHFISRVQVLQNWPQLKAQFLRPNFNPKEILLLEDSELKKIGWDKMRKVRNQEAHVKQRLQRSNAEIWTAEVNQPGFFVLSNMMYPGWTATVNGKEIPILRAYGLFQAVWLGKAGKYVIKFRYKPSLFPIYLGDRL